MKKILKKAVISSLVLAIALSVTAVCKSSDNLDWININPNVSASSDCGVSGEKCGDEMSWVFYSDTGLLEIKGKGTMYRYDSEEITPPENAVLSPWTSLKNDIKTVSFESGITGIGVFAFHDCVNLTSVSLPDTLKVIERSAFEGCTNLTDVVLPDSVEKIGEWAFCGCKGITEIDFPESLTDIGRASFEGTGLKKVCVPNNAANIGRGAFAVCENLTEVKLPDNLAVVARELFCFCNQLEEIQLPETVTYIGRSAFENCTKLSRINIPNSVKEITMDAFSGCESLDSIELPDNISFIGINAFNNSGIYNNPENWENGVLYIGDYLVAAKENLAGDCEIKDGTKCVASYAFNCCSELKNVTVPASVKVMSAAPFIECGSLESVTFLGNTEITEILVSDYETSAFYKIYCKEDSNAYRFAIENSIPFELIENDGKGDVDRNGEINSADALEILECSAGVRMVMEDEAFFRADVNGDNEINSSDALEVLKYTVGIINKF